MYLKRSKRFTVTCGILAAVFLSLGIWLIQYGPLRQTAIYETTWAETRPLMSTWVTEEGNELSGTQEIFDHSEEIYYTEGYPAAKEAPITNRQVWSWIGISLVVAGLGLSVIFIFFCKQEQAILGLDGSLASLLLGGYGYWLLFTSAKNTYFFQLGSALLRLENVYYLLLNGLYLALVLVVLRELMAWVWNRCPISWMAAHRLGMFGARIAGRKSDYLFCWTIFGVLVILVYGLTTRTMSEYETIYLVMRCGQAAQGAITLVGILCFFRDLNHMTKQVAAIHEEREVLVNEGIFREEEEQLLDLSRKTEEAIRTAVTSERFKVDLISNVSHDLRTPLTAILGYGELLKKEELSETGAKQLSALNQKASYMSDLVESLFELTKVSSGVLECKQEEIDLIRLLEQTLGLFDEELQHRNLVVRRHYEKESIPLVTDGSRMYQVFANLVGNAIKYTLSGTRIHLEVKEMESQVEIRLVNIASYEMDFDPEEILQRFARGDQARSTKGSGLGLAIAQTYTESVGGEFSVAIDGEQFSAIVRLPKN